MTEDTQILQEFGLLSWKTVEVGFRRGWIDAHSIEGLAERALDRTKTTDTDLAALAVTVSLAQNEIEDLLTVIAHRLDPATDEEIAVKRWLLGRLIGLRRSSRNDKDLADRAEETRAEFGFPAELDGVGRYDFTPEEREADLAKGDRSRSPLDALDGAIERLKARLTGDATSPSSVEQSFIIHLGMSAAEIARLEADARLSGMTVFELDLESLPDRTALGEYLAEVFEFPHKTSGLDAALDMLSDLEWFDRDNGFLIVARGVGELSSVSESFVAILPNIVDRWRAQSVPFVVVLDGQGEHLESVIREANRALERAGDLPWAQPGTGPVEVEIHDGGSDLPS